MKTSSEDIGPLSTAAPTPKRLLLVDDEQDARDLARDVLEEDGWDVSGISDGAEALDILKQEAFDLVLLDLRMPFLDGFEVLRRARKFCLIPFVALSALNSVEDRKRFLDLGGNDYIAKPFTTQELRFRTWAAVRSHDEQAAAVKHVFDDGCLRIDLDAHQVTVGGKEVLLTAREYELLHELKMNAGVVLSSEYLLKKIWGIEYGSDTDLLYTCVARLRSKIEPDRNNPRYVITLDRVGYRFKDFA